MNIPALYAQAIQAIGDGTGMADSLLHVHAGMAVLIFTRIVTRRSLATPLPLKMVGIAEAANEILDRLHYGSWRWPDTVGDFANTSALHPRAPPPLTERKGAGAALLVYPALEVDERRLLD